ncbi:podocalyxin [Scyliorhinus canicula]|uniref:podocalyxin n=1 Tax=Scyliorhinus canicula TaxID=7830 RepID=UPI0018F3E806|nr:podocalyxin [Scyliorhinus canicula]
MRLLFVVCFLGSTCAAPDTNSTAIQTQPAGVPNITSTSTQNSTSPKNDVTTQSSITTQTIKSPESTSNNGTTEGKSSASTETSKLSTVSSSGTPKVINSTATTLTPGANMTSDTTTVKATTHTTQIIATTVQIASVTSSSSAPPQSQNSTSKTLDSTTQASANTTVSESQTTTGANESKTATSPSTTSSVGLSPAAQESTQPAVTSNSTTLISTPEDGTVTQATRGSLQTNPTTLQNVFTETYKDVTSGTQESTVTALTTRSVSSWPPKDTPRPNIQSTVKCVPESSNQTSIVALREHVNCDAFVNKMGKGLIDLFCSKLVKKEDLKVFNHCEIRLSPTKEKNKKMFNIDIYFKVDSKKVDNFLAKLPEMVLKEVGITFSANKGDSNERQTATELKKLIAMVVTGSLLVLVFLSAIIYRCAQRKSQLKKDQCLKGEMYMVDNGCHDNPAMDVIESEPEMQEKTISKANCQENMDGWIVPIDSFNKCDLEEEDTHL